MSSRFFPRSRGVTNLLTISRRNLVDDWRSCWLAHPGSRSQGILGARTFVFRDRKLCPCISGKAKRVNPLTDPSSFSPELLSVSSTGVRTKTSSRGSQIGDTAASPRWLRSGTPSRETCSTCEINHGRSRTLSLLHLRKLVRSSLLRYVRRFAFFTDCELLAMLSYKFIIL